MVGIYIEAKISCVRGFTFSDEDEALEFLEPVLHGDHCGDRREEKDARRK